MTSLCSKQVQTEELIHEKHMHSHTEVHVLSNASIRFIFTLIRAMAIYSLLI